MTDAILSEVMRERLNQDRKWGEQNHTPNKWFTILIEEVGEAAKAALDDDLIYYRQEMVQVAAVAVAMIESYDRNDRKATNG